jgi:hypothetical protein
MDTLRGSSESRTKRKYLPKNVGNQAIKRIQMLLTPSQIDDIISRAGRPEEIEEAIKEESRARFHTEPSSFNSARTNFMAWVKQLIDPNKYAIFEHLLTDPIPTIDVSEAIFNEVKKVFEAQDRHISYQFVNPDLNEDFDKYLKQLQDEPFWRVDGLHVIKNAYNSIMVVDVPSVPETGLEPINGVVLSERPKPYYYVLPIDKVLQIEIDKYSKRVEYIFFVDVCTPDRGYIFDDGFYRTLTRENGKWRVIGESSHDLGYTPAKSFWASKLNGDSQIRKRGLVTNSLGNFDRLLFKIVSENHVELYAEYPIMTMFSQKCDYMDATGNSCEGGKVKKLMKNGFGGSEYVDTYETCPKCNGGVASLGAGSIFEAPAMTKSDDPNLIDAVKFVTVGVESLKWINEKVSNLKNELTYSIIGIVDEVSGIAINKDQVQSQYESRQNVLLDIKNNLEDIHRWTHETVAFLRYGKSFKAATINYGTKFFLQTAGQLNEQYLKSRDSGIPAFELANQRVQIYETKYRSNPDMLQRIRILMAIEPYQDYSISQIKDLITLQNIFDKRQLLLKLNFDSYIQRFEREMTDVVSFMQFAPFSQKVNMILEILLSYVDEGQISSQSAQNPPVV